ncbi:LANO_0E09868g1_1 [Lachancea nothofagi CBS 11611]|uniref:L-serine ammonia-lyase n=1 Tax=Lachancea nothofagi CBS 11611 TaxID=1266666 RepID=A0A1G4JWA1_9SACH|nr:LANO_0E09868g1_1 [Lachancea nothofagi CBS 11611]
MSYVRTPLIHREFNNKEKGPKMYLKYEMLQPGGSFKSRGISHLIAKAKRKNDLEKNGENKLAVYTSSGGNAGLAAATAAKSIGLGCTVVVPKLTKHRMIEKIKSAGATVIVHGDHWGLADLYLREKVMVEARACGLETLYVHPFDDETVWEGHSSIVDEIVQQLEQQEIPLSRLKGIVCSVGGGGLFSGIVKGLENKHLAETVPIVAVETEGCDVLAKSLANGSPVTLDKITSIASSLGSPYIASFAFDSAKKYESKSVVLQDSEVLETCMKFTDDSGIITEPACGASLHLCYHPNQLQTALGSDLTEDDVIVVIACGGSCVSFNELSLLSNSRL